MPKVTSSLREFRQARALSQEALARRVGLSRQALCAIEAGSAVPGTDVALRLAQALGVRVETLFQLEQRAPPLQATLAGLEPLATAEPTRVVLADIDGRWVAHPIDLRQSGAGALAADGLALPARGRRRARGVQVEPLTDLEAARERLVVMGCAPALGLLAARLGDSPSQVRLSWVQGTSTAALDALRRGEIHLAGVHLLDEASGQYNEPIVRRQLADQPMLLVNLTSWEQGIVVARDNPLKIRGAADLLRPKIRFVSREPGAGAHKLLDQALRTQGARARDVKGSARLVHGHMEVAEAIALGAADAGIAIRSAALAYGLDFIALAEERFDLVIPRELGTDPRVEQLVDVLGSRSFRRELDCVGGYLTGESGQQVGDTRRR